MEIEKERFACGELVFWRGQEKIVRYIRPSIHQNYDVVRLVFPGMINKQRDDLSVYTSDLAKIDVLELLQMRDRLNDLIRETVQKIEESSQEDSHEFGVCADFSTREDT